MLRSWDRDIRFLDREYVRATPAPLETPSHNGPWRGRVPVVMLAPGVMGEDLPACEKRLRYYASRDRGRLVLVQNALRRRLAGARVEDE